MKGMISGIKRMEVHDGDGLRTTVFFKGCPLRCIWCHNPESLSFEKQIAFFKSKCISCGICKNERNEEAAEECPTGAIEVYGREYEVEELAQILLQDEAFFKNSGGGVTLSGGECLAQPDFCIALAKLLHERDISVYVDTCGYVKREIFEKMIPYTDKFLYDIKAIDATVHEKCTGRQNRLILDNLKYLCNKGCKIEIRYPLVKGYNDLECENIAKFLSGLQGMTKVKVLQYHRFSASRYEALGMFNTLPDTQTTSYDIEAAVNIFKNYGLNAVNGMRED
jgi:pyruvate formate lyase activating enzyme